MTTRPDAELKEIADAITSVVAGIEGQIETTRGHYGAYMNLLMTVAKGDNKVASNLARTLKSAGANERGVDDALRIVIGG